MRILPLRAGAGCERDTPDNCRGERQTPSSLGNLSNVHCFLVDICCENQPTLTPRLMTPAYPSAVLEVWRVRPALSVVDKLL